LGEIDVQEYGSKIGQRWIEKLVGVRISFPISWETVENVQPRGTVTKLHVGKPIFVTGAFFSPLKEARTAEYKWELVVTPR